MNKFSNVKIDELTDSECRELLRKIEGLVGDMPSFIDYGREGGYGQTYDLYSCCTGRSNVGHDKDCAIGNLQTIFGY